MFLIVSWSATDNWCKQELVGDAGIGESIHVSPNWEENDGRIEDLQEKAIGLRELLERYAPSILT